MDWHLYNKFYTGFWLEGNQGNNAFSLNRRGQQRIYVAPFREGSPADLQVGLEVAFSEIEDGTEKNFPGLAAFIGMRHLGRPAVIFDNHNHAFFCWVAALMDGFFDKGATLVHVDQHTDMRKPNAFWAERAHEEHPGEAAFRYTNFHLNVGNFIQPALAAGFFSEVIIIDSSAGFERALPDKFVLDIDIDIFFSVMAYIDEVYKLEKIRGYLKRSLFTTVATSPFFMPQREAIDIICNLFAT